MEPQVAVLVPSKEKKAFLLTDAESKTLKLDEVLEWLEGVNGFQLLGPMGGPGQNLFVRASQSGKEVHRIPWFRLEAQTGVTAGASTEERARAIFTAWRQSPGTFYPLMARDADILMVRELTRVRLNIQEYRKRATLQYKAAWRDLSPLVPREILEKGEETACAGYMRKNPKAKKPKPDYTSEEFINFLNTLSSDFRRLMELRAYFANPGMIRGAKQDEEELERRIIKHVVKLPIWHWLHPEKGSVLPRILGLGPSLGGSLIGEIGDIRAFPAVGNLRSYARMHVNAEGEFPHRRKGEVSSWNRYLNRAVWLWSTDQMPRYDHVWRQLYDYRKALELQAHPEPEPKKVVDRRNRERIIWQFTLKHCDSRAKRWVGVKLLEYVYELWSVGERGIDPERWYSTSRYPEFFQRVETELESGLSVYLKAEIPKRRRREPEEESEEES